MQKWTSRIETPIKAELICYDVNGIHIVFEVSKELFSSGSVAISL